MVAPTAGLAVDINVNLPFELLYEYEDAPN
jgi:hypothetical protein